MIKAIVSDFSRTLLFPTDDSYHGSLNELYKTLKSDPSFVFFDHFRWNEPLAEIYKQFKLQHDAQVYIFTTEKIQEDSALAYLTSTDFAGVITVSDIGGLGKENADAYLEVAKRLQMAPAEIIFIDDSDINLAAAKSVGINVIKYSTPLKIAGELTKF